MTTLEKLKDILIEIIMGDDFEKRFNQLFEKKIQKHTKVLEDRWIGEDEARKLLGLSRPTMYKLRRLGKLRYKTFGKKIKYLHSYLLNIDK